MDWMRSVAYLSAFTALASCSPEDPPPAADQIAETIRARRLEIVNKQDKVVMRLESDVPGGCLTVFDANGELVAMLVVGEHGGGRFLLGRAGRSGPLFYAGEGGGAGGGMLMVGGPDGEKRPYWPFHCAVAGPRGGAKITMSMPDGKDRVVIQSGTGHGVAPEGGTVKTYDIRGIQSGELPKR